VARAYIASESVIAAADAVLAADAGQQRYRDDRTGVGRVGVGALCRGGADADHTAFEVVQQFDELKRPGRVPGRCPGSCASAAFVTDPTLIREEPTIRGATPNSAAISTVRSPPGLTLPLDRSAVPPGGGALDDISSAPVEDSLVRDGRGE